MHEFKPQDDVPMHGDMDTRVVAPIAIAVFVALCAVAAVVVTRDDAAPEREGPSPRQLKVMDYAAHSDARNAVIELEGCYVETLAYDKCDISGSGLAIGGGPGQVEVVEATPDTYRVTAHSESGVGFSIEKRANGMSERACEPVSTATCGVAGTW